MKRFQIKFKNGFTLVELIVAIIILAILSTIGYISILGYSRDARDSTRLSDVKTIGKTLEIYKVQENTYPLPENGVEITYSGAEIWTQGEFGEETRKIISKRATISTSPNDPLTLTKYTYSVLNTRLEYQLGAILEGGAISQNTQSIISKTQALEKATAYIKGDYNGQVAKVQTGSTTYVLAVPTIINSYPSLKDYQTLVNNKLLVFNGYKNLPGSYSGTNLDTNGETNLLLVNSDNIQVYNGSIDSLSDVNNLKALTENLQLAYSGTLTSTTNQTTQNLLTVDTNNSQELTTKIGTLVNNTLGGDIDVSSATSYLSCLGTQTTGTQYPTITYTHTTLNHAATTTGTGTESITYGTKNYTSTIGCNDGTNIITNEEITITCDPNYVEDSGSCVLNICSGTIPEYAISNAIEEQNETSWTYNTTPGVCTYECNSGYHTEDGGTTCILDTRNCSVTNGSGIQTWTGIDWSDCDVNSCETDYYKTDTSVCSPVGNGYYSATGDITRTSCTNYLDTETRDYTYTSSGNGTNNCSATYTGLCGIDLYETSNGTCSAVGIGYYSPDLNNTQTSCTNAPENSTYTSDGNGTNNCSFTCNIGYTYDNINNICNDTADWIVGDFGTCTGTTAGTRSSRGSCSVSCGGGIKYRYRSCISNSGSQTRSVICKRSDGTIVDDSFCTTLKPSTSQSCTGSCGSTSDSTSCNTHSCCVSGVGISCVKGTECRRWYASGFTGLCESGTATTNFRMSRSTSNCSLPYGCQGSYGYWHKQSRDIYGTIQCNGTCN